MTNSPRKGSTHSCAAKSSGISAGLCFIKYHVEIVNFFFSLYMCHVFMYSSLCVSRKRRDVIYRVFHDLRTLLLQVISQVLVIKKVHINMCPILDRYGVRAFFNSRTRPRVNRFSRNQLAGDVLSLVAYLLRCLVLFPPADTRSSQPSGSLCRGWRWHFRKPALSTDQFKLKVISRS